MSPGLFSSILCVHGAVAAFIAVPFLGPVAGLVGVSLLGLHLALNGRFYRVLLTSDPLRLPAHIMLGVVDHLWCGFGGLAGVLAYLGSSERRSRD